MKVRVKKGDFEIETELMSMTHKETFDMLLKLLDKVKEILK